MATRPKTPARGAADFRGALQAWLDRKIAAAKSNDARIAFEAVRVYARTFKYRAKKREGGL